VADDRAPVPEHECPFRGVSRHHLFLFGDYDSPERLLAYNLKTRQSETFTLGYTAARHTAAVVADGQIYVIGGRVDRATDPIRAIQVFALTKPATRTP